MRKLYYIKQQPHSLITFHCPDDVKDVKINDYAYVWYGDVNEDFGDVQDTYVLLDLIFRKFNVDHPNHFAGHSLSVGDIVMLCDLMKTEVELTVRTISVIHLDGNA